MNNHQLQVFCHLTLGMHAPYPYMPPPGFDLYSELSLMAEEARWWIEEKADAVSYSLRDYRERIREKREERATQREFLELMEAYAGGE